MSELNRRDIIRAAAAGAALAGGAAATTAGRSPAELRRERRAAAVRATVRRALPGEGLGLSPVEPATVAMCRSFDGQVLLEFTDGRCGLVALDARGFTVAAAAQAAGRTVQVRWWGHEPAAEGGLGRFAGALLALDADDLADGEEVRP
ncbi:MAG: hypothetical protein JNK15_05400 [Planctomycetes bacterium]|nr:hypothetical protein [Planctomycetota bacterium]